MKKILKKNQVILTVLTMLVAVAGYLNYSGKADEMLGIAESSTAESSLDAEAGKDAAAAGEDLVEIDSLDDPQEAAADESGGLEEVSSPGEAILTNGVTVSDFLAQAKLTREQTRGQNREALLEIVNNTELEETTRQAAVDQLVAQTSAAELESTIEMLLSSKGFENTIVSVLDDSVDVVVCRSSITDAERAQIEDIVKRKTELSADHIVITLMELKK